MRSRILSCTLQRTLTHCNILLHTATHCNTLSHHLSYSLIYSLARMSRVNESRHPYKRCITHNIAQISIDIAACAFVFLCALSRVLSLFVPCALFLSAKHSAKESARTRAHGALVCDRSLSRTHTRACVT